MNKTDRKLSKFTLFVEIAILIEISFDAGILKISKAKLYNFNNITYKSFF